MSNPIFLIIQREFLSRVRKKTFILVTLIGPLAFAALMIVPGLLASMPEDNKRIVVLDEPSLLLPHEGKEQYTLEYLDPRENDLELAKDLLRDSEYDALLYIPSGENWDPDFIKNNILLFGKEDPSMELQGYLDYLLEEQINQAKLLKNGVDPEIVAQIKTNVNIKSFTLGEEGNDEQSAVPIKMALGYITGMLIYFFIFFYSVQVMRGVMEEKSSRIVEVIISSVRPYQLMMGKILGIGLVGVLQFIIWIGLSGVLYTVISTLIFPELFAQQAAAGIAGNPAADTVGLEVMDMLRSVNFTTIITGFAFYFFGGYFLYSALFAAVGSAVDQEADSQQFMLPVTIPMILAIITAMNVIQEPNGSLAFWMSMIPLTSPITMMIRLPFGIPLWEVFLSGAILVATFFIVVGLAGKIYRVGILMYGKKVTWKELFKWLKY
ncbi:MAG: ABC transporter permease [Cryomorphaceae bacterium]|nr:ABC transporter permease [Cryomorphaceae bacterium]MBL6866859.1 ABC transporter permease [Cryomorphaceae bacterium]